MVTQCRTGGNLMSTRLTNTEKYAIQGMLGDDKTVNDIAELLKLPEKAIQNYIDKLSQSIKKIEGNIESFGIVTQNHKAAIMTEAASQRVDDRRSKRQSTKTIKSHLINIKTGKPYNG